MKRSVLVASAVLLVVAMVLPVGAADAPQELGSAFEADGPGGDLRVYFLDGGLRFGSRSLGGWTLDLAVAEVSEAEQVDRVSAVRLAAGGNRVEYAYTSRIEGWYENGPHGLAQTFRILAPAVDGAALAVDLAARGDAAPKLDRALNKIDFHASSGPVLRFGDLRAADADGNEVPVRLELAGPARVRIVVERAPSAYPVTVTGTFAAPKARRSSTTYDASDASDRLVPMAPPANDLCAGATVVPGNGPFPHLTGIANITDATTTGDPVSRPSCAFVGEAVTRSVWYSFTPTTTGTYTFTTCADAPTATTVDDTILAIYSSAAGCAGPFTELLDGCDDDGCISEEFQSFLATPLTAGTTYYVVVWNQGPAPLAGNAGVQLLVTASIVPNPPPNDTCGGAETIPGAGPFPYLTATTADITDAGTVGDPPVPSCSAPGSPGTRSIWYSFTPAATGLYTLSTCDVDLGGTGTTVDDTIVAVYTSAAGCAGPFAEIPTAGLSDGCDDDGCASSLQSALTTTLNAGTPYYVLVSKVGTGVPPISHTAVQLRVVRPTVPANDQCTSAVPLLLDTPVGGTTVSAADDYRTPATTACYSGVAQTTSTAVGRDVSYEFTAPSTASYSFRVTGFDTTLLKNLVTHVASDCPIAGSPPRTVSCLKGANRNSSFSAEEVNCIPISAGTTVYAFVDEDEVSGGSSFTIEVNRCQAETEPNDTTAQANVRSCGLEGAIGTAGEVDFYALNAVAAGSRLFAMVDGVAGNTGDFDLRMTTAADTVEYDDLNLDLPFGSLAPVLAGTPFTGAVSYLRVSVNSAAVAAEPYRMFAVVQAPLASAAAEAEPNDTTVQANESPAGYFSGTLAGPAPSTDVDLFAFDAVAGDLIFLGLDADPTRNNTPINGALALLDAGGNTLVSVNDGAFVSSTTAGTGALNKTVPFSPGEGIVWRARYTGRHHARVAIGTASTDASGAGDYLLSISLDCFVTDRDGDGVPNIDDCAPTDAGAYARPGEATNLLFDADRQTLTWSPAGGGAGTTHSLLRGAISALPVGPGGGDEFCIGGIAGTSTPDGAVPATGAGFWYVVRGKNSCGAGTYGTVGSGGTPGDDRASTTCP